MAYNKVIAASRISSGVISVTNGGTGVDLHTEGGTRRVIAQDISHVVSSRDLLSSDIPTLAYDASGVAAALIALEVIRADGAYDAINAASSAQSNAESYTDGAVSLLAPKLSPVFTGNIELLGAHGEQWIRGQITEQVTLSIVAAFTDSSTDLLPANSIIESVVSRITTTIPSTGPINANAQNGIGTGYLVSDTGTVNGGNSSATYIIDSVVDGWVATAVVNVGGSGYAHNDTVLITGGDGFAELTVDTVDGFGAVLTFSGFVAHGSGYSAGTKATTTGGGGDNALTVDITVQDGRVSSYTLTAPGNGYSVASNVATTDAAPQAGVGTGFTIDISSVIKPTTLALEDGSTANRFSTAGSGLTAGSTRIGTDQIDAGFSRQVAAAPVRIALDQIPDAGVVRVTVFYSQFVAPTS